MLNIQKQLSTSFLILLSLPTTAVGFCLSAGVASMSWILSTRYGLKIDDIALIWLMGPLFGLIVQPIVGWLSDRTWLWNSRRKPYLVAGGLAGAAALVALLKMDVIAELTGLSIFAIAIMVAVVSDLSINVTFNPARSLVADVTPEGPDRTRGYSWMQTVSGTFGISAYLISITLGNVALVWASAVIMALFSIAPLFFIEEPAPLEKPVGPEQFKQKQTSDLSAFKSLLPMSGFLVFGTFVAIDKLALENGMAGLYVPLFLVVIAVTLIWGAAVVWQGNANPTPENRVRKILLGHGFAWLGIQSMFVMAFFFVHDFVLPTTSSDTSIASTFMRLLSGSSPSSVDTAGNILSLGFLLMNLVGAILPVTVLDPLCLRWGRVMVHRSAIGSMVLGYLLVSYGASGELFYYAGMLLCGIGWASTISIVFAIYTESVDPEKMGLNMSIFNCSLVLPALAVPGLLKLSTELGGGRWMFMLFALCLAVSFAFWCMVTERKTPGKASHVG